MKGKHRLFRRYIQVLDFKDGSQLPGYIIWKCALILIYGVGNEHITAVSVVG